MDNWIFAKLIPLPIPSPDSQSYLGWSIFRTLGYPIFLSAYKFVFDSWALLPIFQLNVVLAGMFTLSLAITRVTGSHFAGWLFLVLTHGAGSFLLSSAFFLTEAAFSGFILMHIGFAILFVQGRNPIHAVLAGITIAMTILIKSVSVVFLVPILILTIFALPKRRTMFLLAVFCPALAAFIIPSAYNYRQNGVFESSVAGGFAVAGHVGWGIRPNPGSRFQEEARLVEERLRPVLSKRPHQFATWREYVDYTVKEYNPMLWLNIVPALANYHEGICIDKKKLKINEPGKWGTGSNKNSCMVVLNNVLVGLSKEAIANNPREYAEHVTKHYWGLWKFVFLNQDVLRGTNSLADLLPSAYLVADGFYLKLLNVKEKLPDSSSRAEFLRTIESSFLYAMQDFLLVRTWVSAYPFTMLYDYAEIVIGLSLLGVAAAYWLMKLHPTTAAFSYVALCVNAYFVGHALAQPALERYAATMQGVVIALLVLGLFGLNTIFLREKFHRVGSAGT